MRKTYLLPNLFTSASLFCGILAILNVLNVANAEELITQNYRLSCWLIIAAAVLDMLDGWVARLTNTTSLFGVQYDSLADVVAFGVAPAVLIYTRMSSMENRDLAEVIVTIYVICGALRLARFNVQSGTAEKAAFRGMPIPAAAGTVVSGFLFFESFDPEWDKQFVLQFLPLLMVGLSYLMVSTIKYPSAKQLNLEKRRAFEFLALPPLLLAVILLLKNHIPLIMFTGFLIYMIGPVVYDVVRRIRLRGQSHRHVPPPSSPAP